MISKPKMSLLAGLIALSTISQARDLPQVLREALATDPKLSEAITNQRMASSRLQQTQAARWPVLGASAGQRVVSSSGSGRGFTPSLKGTWRIYDFGQNKARVMRDSEKVGYYDYKTKETAEELIYEVASYYLEALKSHMALQVAKRNLKRHKEIVRMLKIIVEYDSGRRSELTQARSRLLQVESDISKYQRSLGLSLLRLSRYVKKDVTASDLKDPFKHLSAEQLLKAYPKGPHILRSHPSYIAQQKEMNSIAAAWVVAKKERWPGIDLVGTATPGESAVYLNLDVELYNRATRSGLEEKKLQIKAAQAQLTQIQRNLEERARLAELKMQQDQNRIYIANNQIKALRQVARDYEDQFSIAKRSLLEVVNAYKELAGIDLFKTETQYDLMVAKLDYLSAVGALRRWVGVKDKKLLDDVDVVVGNPVKSAGKAQSKQPVKSDKSAGADKLAIQTGTYQDSAKDSANSNANKQPAKKIPPQAEQKPAKQTAIKALDNHFVIKPLTKRQATSPAVLSEHLYSLSERDSTGVDMNAKAQPKPQQAPAGFIIKPQRAPSGLVSALNSALASMPVSVSQDTTTKAANKAIKKSTLRVQTGTYQDSPSEQPANHSAKVATKVAKQTAAKAKQPVKVAKQTQSAPRTAPVKTVDSRFVIKPVAKKAATSPAVLSEHLYSLAGHDKATVNVSAKAPPRAATNAARSPTVNAPVGFVIKPQRAPLGLLTVLDSVLAPADKAQQAPKAKQPLAIALESLSEQSKAKVYQPVKAKATKKAQKINKKQKVNKEQEANKSKALKVHIGTYADVPSATKTAQVVNSSKAKTAQTAKPQTPMKADKPVKTPASHLAPRQALKQPSKKPVNKAAKKMMPETAPKKRLKSVDKARKLPVNAYRMDADIADSATLSLSASGLPKRASNKPAKPAAKKTVKSVEKPAVKPATKPARQNNPSKAGAAPSLKVQLSSYPEPKAAAKPRMSTPKPVRSILELDDLNDL